MLLDTNILIGHMNGDEAIRAAMRAWRSADVTLSISSITLGELLSYQKLTDAEIRDLEEFAASFGESVPFDGDLAKKAAALRRKYGFDITDAGILATAQAYGESVVTRDTQLRKAKEINFVHV